MFAESTKRGTLPTLAVGQNGNLGARMTKRRPLTGQSFGGFVARSLWAIARDAFVSWSSRTGAPSLAGTLAACATVCALVAAVLAVAILGR